MTNHVTIEQAFEICSPLQHEVNDINPSIYNITLNNNGALFVISDIWITENKGGLNRAISEAIYLAKDSMGMSGDINYVSHTAS